MGKEDGVPLGAEVGAGIGAEVGASIGKADGGEKVGAEIGDPVLSHPQVLKQLSCAYVSSLPL